MGTLESELFCEVGTTAALNPKRDPKLVASSVRTFATPFISSGVRTIKSLLYSGPVFLGLLDESQKVDLPLFNGFVEDDRCRTSILRLTLSKKNAGLRIVSARVVFHVELRGFQWYMYHWRVPTAVLVIMWLFAIEVFLVSIFVLLAYVLVSDYLNSEGSDSSIFGPLRTVIHPVSRSRMNSTPSSSSTRNTRSRSSESTSSGVASDDAPGLPTLSSALDSPNDDVLSSEVEVSEDGSASRSWSTDPRSRSMSADSTSVGSPISQRRKSSSSSSAASDSISPSTPAQRRDSSGEVTENSAASSNGSLSPSWNRSPALPSSIRQRK